MNTTETVSNDIVVEDTNASVTTTVEDTTSAAVASAAASVSTPTVSAPKRPGRPRKADSGLNICRGLYEKNPSTPRADMVKAFIAAGVNKDTANTYYHVVHNAATGKTKTKTKASSNATATAAA